MSILLRVFHLYMMQNLMSVPVFVHSGCESSKSHSSSSLVNNNEKLSYICWQIIWTVLKLIWVYFFCVFPIDSLVEPTKIPRKSIKIYNRTLILCKILFYLMVELKRFVSWVIKWSRAEVCVLAFIVLHQLVVINLCTLLSFKSW